MPVRRDGCLTSRDGPHDTDPVGIVGAGIAGLTAALSLARKGWRVSIFEKAVELRAVGAGIQLSPNALRVLARLDLSDAIASASVPARSVVLRHCRDGRMLARVPVTASDGTGYATLQRSDLQEVLLRAVRASGRVQLHLDHAIEGFDEADDGVTLAMRGSHGGPLVPHRVTTLVGADGARSAVACILGRPPAEETGMVAARFIVSDGSLSQIEAWLGPRRHAVAYPMSGSGRINLVLIAPHEDEDAAIARGFARWDVRLRQLLDGAEFLGTWPLLQTERRRPFAYGRRVCLIGDAAHAMLPYAAQGAAMAIEDGFVLAEALVGRDGVTRAPDALARFEAARLARIERVRARVAFHRLVYHLPYPLAIARDLALARQSPKSLAADLAWLYDWAP